MLQGMGSRGTQPELRDARPRSPQVAARDLDACGTVRQTGLVRALTKAHPAKAGVAKPRVLVSPAPPIDVTRDYQIAELL